MFRILAMIAVATFVAGCAAKPDFNPLAGNDPANPQSPEAQVESTAIPLTLEPLPPVVGPEVGLPAGGRMEHMDMSHGQNPATTQLDQTTPETAGVFHHSHRESATQPAATQSLFTCKMHPQVQSTQSGMCPICGMKLVPKENRK